MPSSTKRLFPLSEGQVGAARTWLQEIERVPRQARRASSVVLLSDSAQGTQVYLGYRSADSPLGKVAFPGGSLEETDDEAVSWIGPSPAQWARTLGLDDIGLARRHVVAAIREVFEETGVVLAGRDASGTVEGAQTPEWVDAREAVAAQDRSFAQLLGKRGLSLRTDLLKPVAHWLSPDFAHRRFDSWYFAVALPVNQAPSLLPSKGRWAEWVSAAELATQMGSTGIGDRIGAADTVGRRLSELTLPATALIAEQIGRSRGCIGYLSHRRPVRLHQPELVEVDGAPMLEVDLHPAERPPVQRER